MTAVPYGEPRMFSELGTRSGYGILLRDINVGLMEILWGNILFTMCSDLCFMN